jgi:hypothetical protein
MTEQPSLLTRRWLTGLCNTGEACWCRVISVENPVDTDDYVIPSGSIPKAVAEHVVQLHNASLAGRPEGQALREREVQNILMEVCQIIGVKLGPGLARYAPLIARARVLAASVRQGAGT